MLLWESEGAESVPNASTAVSCVSCQAVMVGTRGNC